MYNDQQSDYISHPHFHHLGAQTIIFYTLTQSSFISHTHIYQRYSPLLIHSSVQKRTKWGENKSMETTYSTLEKKSDQVL